MEQAIAKSVITINATPARVWEALTDPAQIKQYMFGADVHTDWKVGSPISYTGEWEGAAYEDKGTILEIEQEKVLRNNYWSSFSGKPDQPENYHEVTYRLQPTDAGTELSITQTANDAAAAKESEGNWQTILQTIKQFIEQK